MEDFDLCEATQKNLEQGIYEKGSLHPDRENGVVFYQGEVRRMLEEWAAREKEKKKEINAAGFAVDDEEGDGIGGFLERFELTSPDGLPDLFPRIS